MRLLASCAGLLALFIDFGVPSQEQDRGDSCGFAVQGAPIHPTISGPEDIVPRVHVVDQPDSPIEMVSMDLTGMWLTVANEQHTERDCASFKVRNRSNRAIRSFLVQINIGGLAGGGGPGAGSASLLAPGETMEIKSCSGGGGGNAPGNHVRLLVSVRSVDFGECFYRPSERIPKSLGFQPIW